MVTLLENAPSIIKPVYAKVLIGHKVKINGIWQFTPSAIGHPVGVPLALQNWESEQEADESIRGVYPNVQS